MANFGYNDTKTDYSQSEFVTLRADLRKAMKQLREANEDSEHWYRAIRSIARSFVSNGYEYAFREYYGPQGRAHTKRREAGDAMLADLEARYGAMHDQNDAGADQRGRGEAPQRGG